LSRPLKILICSDYFSTWNIGGATRVVQHQMETLAQSSHSAILLSGAPKEDEGVLPIPWQKKTYKGFFFLPSLLGALLRLRVEWKPDIVHIHQPLIGWLAHVCMPMTVKRIYHFHSFWGEEKQSHAKNGFQKGLSWLKGSMERSLLRRMQHFVVLSEYSEQRLRELGILAPITKIPGAVDLKNWNQSGKRAKLPEEALLKVSEDRLPATLEVRTLNLLSVRRLDPRMGLDLLIQAMGELKKNQPELEIKLTIVGTGREENNLKNLCRDLGLQSMITFEGRVSEDRLHELMWEHDVMVIPTRELEGFGLSVIEAWAAGLPVLATSIGGLIEFSKHVPAIHLVGEPTVENLVAGINYVLEQGRMASKLSKTCRLTVEQHYSFEVVGQALLALYEK
jgi:glycosyltransferase involved in cell wall biosynthesis